MKVMFIANMEDSLDYSRVNFCLHGYHYKNNLITKLKAHLYYIVMITQTDMEKNHNEINNNMKAFHAHVDAHDTMF